MDIPAAPRTEFVYQAEVDITDKVDLGRAPLGQRFIVPITGGVFEGPLLRGRVLAGGADRQLLRADGVRELDAFYEMQTDDGVVLTVRNQVLIDDVSGPQRYAMSNVRFTAPQGRYDWLNRRMFVGTLLPLAPQRMAVRISVFQVLPGEAGGPV
jgi:hypothetical protein